jgi:hypothetical protein
LGKDRCGKINFSNSSALIPFDISCFTIVDL